MLKAPEPRSTDTDTDTEPLTTRHPRRDDLTFVEQELSVRLFHFLLSPPFTIKYYRKKHKYNQTAFQTHNTSKYLMLNTTPITIKKGSEFFSFFLSFYHSISQTLGIFKSFAIYSIDIAHRAQPHSPPLLPLFSCAK